MPLFPIVFLKLLVTTIHENDEKFPGSFWEIFWLNHIDKIEFEEVERRSKESKVYVVFLQKNMKGSEQPITFMSNALQGVRLT